MKRYDYKNSRAYNWKHNRELSKGDVVRHFVRRLVLNGYVSVCAYSPPISRERGNFITSLLAYWILLRR